ncbi:MAG: cyclic nucleotide-binding domain-containing protein [Candidatus Aureabacteria bacterium]|nr:cyclic nucleotide-binding domain-containing protein [Candidatus Auribacterota bacterium]
MIGLKFLRSHSLFGGIPDEELKKIRPLLKTRHFEKNGDILQEGNLNDRLYCIYKGSVEILKKVSSLEGDVMERIAVLKKGDTFGEMELIDVQPCAATVKCLEETDVLTLSNQDLYKISKENMKTFSFIIMNLAREISRRLRRMDALFASSLFGGSSAEEESAAKNAKNREERKRNH